MAAVARPYPSLTIATVLGAPHEHAEQLHAWSSWVQRQFDIRALEMNRDDIERAVTEVGLTSPACSRPSARHRART